MAELSPLFFPTPAHLRRWFDRYHQSSRELWVGYYRKASGKPSVTWQQSVDEALCVGWIDGIRKSVDDVSYMIRFTPRRPRSIWSAVNIGRVKVLNGEGRMRPAGLKAFEALTENRSGIYSYKRRQSHLEEPYGGMMKKQPEAAAFFDAQPPSYRKVVSWWVISAKKEETRLARIKKLIDASAHGQRL
jgi:uncharacterized protein YdeI (YjbR/CyaY-like superfamily)